MTPPTDHELLARYVGENSREALGELTRRHLDMVYSVALREVRDRHLADDVTQAVFLVLMRQAGRIGSKVVIGGWLFRVTRYAAADARKSRARRERHEREAAMMTPATAEREIEVLWPQVEPLINEALASLPETERNAMVMTYLQGKSHAEVAAALGGTENSARQRVFRAVGKVRAYLARRGVVAGEAALAAALAKKSATAAPPEILEHALAATSGGAASTVSHTFCNGVIHMMKRAKVMQLATAAAVGLAVSAAGIWVWQTLQNSPRARAGDVRVPLGGAGGSSVAAGVAATAENPAAIAGAAATAESKAAETPMQVVQAAWAAAVAGDEDAFIARFEKSSDAEKKMMRGIVRASAAGTEFNKAFAEQYKKPLDAQLAVSLTGGFDPASLETAKETVDGDTAEVNVGRTGPGAIPLRKIKGAWKLSTDVFAGVSQAAVEQSAAVAPKIKAVTAEIKAGKVATAEEARKKLLEALGAGN